MHAPEQVVGNRFDSALAILVGHALAPPRAKLAFEQLVPFVGEKCRDVHAVGDISQRVVNVLDLGP